MDAIRNKKGLHLTLNHEEALVLFDWICRFNNREDNAFEDQSEERVLFDLEALLERSLDEVLSKDYKNAVARSRRLVRDTH